MGGVFKLARACQRRAMKLRLLAACLLALTLSACVTAPPIGQPLPPAFKDANAAFDLRVKAKFPVGSAQSDLLAELAREGFKVTPCADPTGQGCDYQHFASWRRAGAACDRNWQIVWNADGAVISKVEGRYYSTCS